MKQEKISLKSIVYKEILDGIVKGEYKANQILNEKSLVEKFGFSKSPVREALVSLCDEGALRSIPRYGYEVVRFTSKEVKQILNYRLILESGLLRTCYDNITDDQIDELYLLDDLCNSSVEDMWLHWEHNVNFHLKLVSFSKNDYALTQIKKSMEILKRAYAQFYWDKWDLDYNPIDMRYHREIIRCIKDHDIEGCLKNLELDLDDFSVI